MKIEKLLTHPQKKLLTDKWEVCGALSGLVQREMGVSIYDGVDDIDNDILQVYSVFEDVSSTCDRGVWIYALYYKGDLAGVFYAAGRSGCDSQDLFVVSKNNIINIFKYLWSICYEFNFSVATYTVDENIPDLDNIYNIEIAETFENPGE